MNFEEFKTEAVKTESRPEKIHMNPAVFMAAMVAAVDMANMIDLVKKKAFYNKEIPEAVLHASVRNVMDSIMAFAQQTEHMNEADNFEGPNEICLGDTEGKAVSVRHENFPMRLAHSFVGMYTESGEMMQALIASVVDEKPIDAVNIREEFFDSDWYKAVGCDELGIDEQESRKIGIAKLRKRHGEKFNVDGAINRDLEAEREILEGK